MKLEDIKTMKDEFEDIREDRSCGSDSLAQFSREIPRMGEAVTKIAKGTNYISRHINNAPDVAWRNSPQGQL